jgi:alkyldihydroxyacetonephosphate synthase
MAREPQDALAELASLGADDVVAPCPISYRADAWPLRLKRAVAAPAHGVLIRPRTTEAVAEVLAFATENAVSIAPFGAGSNVTGAFSDEATIVLSLENMAAIVDLDHESHVVTVEAGLNGGALEEWLEGEGLTLGHYPQSLCVSTVGGWVATRATGTYSAYYGGIEQLVCGLTLVLPSGEVVDVPARARPAGGLDLVPLTCGSEGSFGVITQVSLAVHRRPAERVVCAAFADLPSGLAATRSLAQATLPLGLVRLYNAAESTAVVGTDADLREGECLLVVTTLGPEPVAESAAGVVRDMLEGANARALPDDAAAPWFARRYAGPGFMEERNAEPGVAFDTIEVALPWRTAASCSDELERALGTLSQPFYLHFSHVYETGACMYMILHLHAADDAEVIARLSSTWSTALAIVQEHGGTIAHHHGIGSVRAGDYAASETGRLHARLARALDPAGVIQPPLLSAMATSHAG